MNISAVFSALMWLSFSGICTYANVFPCPVEVSAEVNSLTVAGMLVTRVILGKPQLQRGIRLQGFRQYENKFLRFELIYIK